MQSCLRHTSLQAGNEEKRLFKAWQGDVSYGRVNVMNGSDNARHGNANTMNGKVDVSCGSDNVKQGNDNVIQGNGNVTVRSDKAMLRNDNAMGRNASDGTELKIGHIHTNLPSKISGMLPDSLPAGTYALEVRNRLDGNKSLVTGVFKTELSVN